MGLIEEIHYQNEFPANKPKCSASSPSSHQGGGGSPPAGPRGPKERQWLPERMSRGCSTICSHPVWSVDVPIVSEPGRPYSNSLVSNWGPPFVGVPVDAPRNQPPPTPPPPGPLRRERRKQAPVLRAGETQLVERVREEEEA